MPAPKTAAIRPVVNNLRALFMIQPPQAFEHPPRSAMTRTTRRGASGSRPAIFFSGPRGASASAILLPLVGERSPERGRMFGRVGTPESPHPTRLRRATLSRRREKGAATFDIKARSDEGSRDRVGTSREPSPDPASPRHPLPRAGEGRAAATFDIQKSKGDPSPTRGRTQPHVAGSDGMFRPGWNFPRALTRPGFAAPAGGRGKGRPR